MPGDLAIHARQDAIEKFHDGDLCAEPLPYRAELQPDHAGADDQQARRHLVERQRTGRRHDVPLVDLDPFQLRNVRAGGNHDIFGLNSLRLAVAAGNFNFARADDLSGAVDDVDLVLPHQELDALDVAVDALLLEVHHRGQVEFRRGHGYSHLRKRMRGLLEHLRGMQQRLRRHAADIETGAAERCVLLDHGDLHAELRCAHRANIPAGTGADDNEIVSRHDKNPVAKECDRY